MAGDPAPKASTKPRFLDDEAFKCLRSGELAQFHRLLANREQVDFTNSDLRGVDLRGADLRKVILLGCYLRDADLRGTDLSAHNLAGCSLFHAKVSGTLFPDSVSAEEIRLSLDYGTRIRKR